MAKPKGKQLPLPSPSPRASTSVMADAGEALRAHAGRALAPLNAAKRFAGRKAGAAAGYLAAAPFRALGASAGDIALGERARTGPMKGLRLQAQRGGPGAGMKLISPTEAAAIRSGKVKGKVISGTVGGRRYLFKRRYLPGGIAGAAARNPIKAGAAGLLAYLMMKNPEARSSAGQASAAQLRAAQGFDPAVLARFRSQPSHDNPLTRQTWG